MSNKHYISKDNYLFGQYMSKARWMSIWHQITETIKLNPSKILEVGSGSGAYAAIIKNMNVDIINTDIAPDLHPDCISNITNLPFKDNSFDLTCAFQVLEHLPFSDSMIALSELCRVSNEKILISLPNSRPSFRIHAKDTQFGQVDSLIEYPLFTAKKHKFDGQHHWEINKKDFSIGFIKSEISKQAIIEKDYRINENPYHHFFLLRKKTNKKSQ